MKIFKYNTNNKVTDRWVLILTEREAMLMVTGIIYSHNGACIPDKEQRDMRRLANKMQNCGIKYYFDIKQE